MKQIQSSKFYFIRHGQTDANKNQQMCGGDWDIPLNKKGKEQALEASKLSHSLLKKIDHVFVSPMIRAKETAQILFTDINCTFEEVEGLREWCVGDWESKPWSDVPNPFNTTEDPKNGETRLQFENRVVDTVSELIEKSKDKKILIVAHGAVAHTLFTFLGVDVPYIENAKIYEINGSQLKWTLSEV